MKKPARTLLIVLSCWSFASNAHAQIVRRIIGHAIIGTAVKSAIGGSHDEGAATSQGVNPDVTNERGASAPAVVPTQSQSHAVRPQ